MGSGVGDGMVGLRVVGRAVGLGLGGFVGLLEGAAVVGAGVITGVGAFVGKAVDGASVGRADGGEVVKMLLEQVSGMLSSVA